MCSNRHYCPKRFFFTFSSTSVLKMLLSFENAILKKEVRIEFSLENDTIVPKLRCLIYQCMRHERKTFSNPANLAAIVRL